MKLKKIAWNAAGIFGWGAAIMLVSYVFIWSFNTIGAAFEPKVREHQMKDATCYTAGKMFFVSIACVPKKGTPSWMQ